MTGSPHHPSPTGYRLRVAGHLDQHWSPWFSGLTLHRDDDGTTSLAGVVADQAELHGLLSKIRDLGVTLISVVAIDPPGSADYQPRAPDEDGADTPGARDTTSPHSPTDSG
ncbi:hypothetical protein BH11ACT1_BH11ACT1_02310 [soil metagenome]